MKKLFSIALCICLTLAAVFTAVPSFAKAEDATDAVSTAAQELLDNFNKDVYIKNTLFQADFSSVTTGEDKKGNFWGSANQLQRRTIYTPGRLYMSNDEGKVNGGYKNVGSDMVRFHIVDGVEVPDYTVKGTKIEEFFTNLDTFTGLVWTEVQDKAGYYRTEYKKEWRDFVAPMWIGEVDAVTFTDVIMHATDTVLYLELYGQTNTIGNTLFSVAEITLPAAEPVAGETLVENRAFSSITGSVQYATETHKITDHVSMDIQNCHINTQLRIYSSTQNNGTAIFKVAAPYTIKSITFNAGYKADNLVVEGSIDGETWETVQTVATSTSYKDYTVDFPENKDYTYFKLDVNGTQQVRIANITITLEEPSVGGCEHSYSEERVNATCEEAGSSRVICNLCGTESTEILNPTGHKWSAYVVTQEATCEEAGSKIRTCETCGITEEPTVIEAKGHKEKEIVTQEATCTATGLAYRQCSVCEKITEENIVISKIPHNYENGACTECGEEDPNAGVEQVTATLTFDDKAKMTSSTTSKQVWEENSITVTYDKNTYSNNLAEYAKPVRFYAGTKVTIAAPGTIIQIVFDCNSSSYATTLKNSIGTVDGVTVSVSSDKVTVTFDPAVDSFAIVMTAQVRMDSITVTYLG